MKKRVKAILVALVGVVLIEVVYHEISLDDTKHLQIATRHNGHQLPVGDNRSFFVNTQQLSDEITVVSAYWNIGQFTKRMAYNSRDNQLYHKWAKAFQFILNPFVVYTDSKDFYDIVRRIRNNTAYRTRILLVDRNSSWAFQRMEKIKQIYSRPGYPRYLPNTVVPEYPCTQHAKYDAVKRAAVQNYFQTKYFTWIDVGLFRSRQSTKMFHLVKPKGYNDSSVVMSELRIRNEKATVENIFLHNMIWVCGGLFFGRFDVMILHADEYQRAVDYFLSRGLMNTDQQILYGMYSQEGLRNIKPTIKIQAYRALGNWFHLAYNMVREVNEVNNTLS